MPILSSYKTGYHLNGQVSPSVKGKCGKPMVPKLIYCSSPAIYFMIKVTFVLFIVQSGKAP